MSSKRDIGTLVQRANMSENFVRENAIIVATVIELSLSLSL